MVWVSREFFGDVRNTLLWRRTLVESVWGESDEAGCSLLSTVLIASLGWEVLGQDHWRGTQISSGLGRGNSWERSPQLGVRDSWPESHPMPRG